MASISKKTRTVYNLEIDEDEMKVLANILYRTQLGENGPGKAASSIYEEVEKYCYVDEFDPEGRPNWIPTNDSSPGSIYWTAPPAWTRDF